MASPLRLRASIACALLLLVGCSADPTQLVVVVDSDIPVPDELDEVRVTVTGPSGTAHVVEQPLAGTDAAMLPLTLGVAPAGDALGPVTIEASGLIDGSAIVTRTVRTEPVRGETLLLHIELLSSCVGTTCAAGLTCTQGGCASVEVDPGDLPSWTGEVPGRDAGQADASTPADGGTTGCVAASECDDGIGCTIDVCDAGACSHRPDDGACDASDGGVCDATNGCQYPVCDATTCGAAPCQTAACEGDVCVRTSLCESGQTCCAGTCVMAACDDGNACTDDACGSSGCLNTANTSACDDGTFCNGADTCMDGTCSAHAGTPCAGSAVCDESTDVCTGCLADTDCPPPSYGAWGSCGGYDDMCDTSGIETRMVTTYSCMAGSCVGDAAPETRACSRSTDGIVCGATSCTGWGACGGFIRACDTTGTESRTCTDYTCAGGSCPGSDRVESRGCTRSTSGNSCDDGYSCTGPDRCSGGDCTGTDLCGPSCTCHPMADTCVNDTDPYELCPY